jgi:hypothetical protein
MTIELNTTGQIIIDGTPHDVRVGNKNGKNYFYTPETSTHGYNRLGYVSNQIVHNRDRSVLLDAANKALAPLK